MSASASPADAMRQEAAQRERARNVEKVENLGTKQWLQSKLEEQAKPVEIFDRDFAFRPIGSERVEEILELATEEAKKTEGVDADNLDDVDPEEMEDMPKLLRTMRETLGDHCLDDDMDASAFGQLPVVTLQEVFEDVAMSGNSPQGR